MNSTSLKRRLNRLENHHAKIQTAIQIVGGYPDSWETIKDRKCFKTLPEAVEHAKLKFNAKEIAVDDTRYIMDALPEKDLRHIVKITDKHSKVPVDTTDPILKKVLVDKSQPLQKAVQQYPNMKIIKNWYEIDLAAQDM